MKKITFCLAVSFLALTMIPLPSKATADVATATTILSESAKKERTDAMMLRLKEIKAMDKSNLSSAERKALRKEVVSMKKEAKEMNGGVYLSVGAIIIVILLLILLL